MYNLFVIITIYKHADHSNSATIRLMNALCTSRILYGRCAVSNVCVGYFVLSHPVYLVLPMGN